jgi:precorrin-6B methylase 2
VVDFETLSAGRRRLKRWVVNPLANYLPAGMVRAVLRLGKSELASANWREPGGWRSMVISYNGRCGQIADRVLVNAGTLPMALRNRKRLASRLIATLIEQSDGGRPAHVLCLGAGPGWIVLDAMRQARAQAEATLVDLNADAFEFGRTMAADHGLGDRVRFIQADVRDLHEYLDQPADVVKMIGICEYLNDEHIEMIARAAAGEMPAGAAIVVNSISKDHGTDRFCRRVFGLRMTYRTPEHIARLMGRAGFGDFEVHAEPLGVYHVMVGRKAAEG